mgnify:FL=1
MDMGDTYTKNANPEEKTPWNPSKKATKRVKDPIDAPTKCPHCQGQVGIKKNSVVYNGKCYGEWPWIYMCLDRSCDSYVGMHPFTNIPLGTLANHEIREARKKAKAKFQSLSAGLDLRRDVMYQMLADEMGIKKKDCHFGHFDVQQCEFAEAACFNLKFNLKR